MAAISLPSSPSPSPTYRPSYLHTILPKPQPTAATTLLPPQPWPLQPLLPQLSSPQPPLPPPQSPCPDHHCPNCHCHPDSAAATTPTSPPCPLYHLALTCSATPPTLVLVPCIYLNAKYIIFYAWMLQIWCDFDL